MLLETQASQKSAKKGTRYTNFSDTDRTDIGRYAAEYMGMLLLNVAIVATRMLVKIEGGARIGIPLILKDRIANYLN